MQVNVTVSSHNIFTILKLNSLLFVTIFLTDTWFVNITVEIMLEQRFLLNNNTWGTFKSNVFIECMHILCL